MKLVLTFPSDVPRKVIVRWIFSVLSKCPSRPSLQAFENDGRPLSFPIQEVNGGLDKPPNTMKPKGVYHLPNWTDL